jgi:hypothetical protein
MTAYDGSREECGCYGVGGAYVVRARNALDLLVVLFFGRVLYS